jgi:hypothetical protein
MSDIVFLSMMAVISPFIIVVMIIPFIILGAFTIYPIIVWRNRLQRKGNK